MTAFDWWVGGGVIGGYAVVLTLRMVWDILRGA